MQVDKDCQTEVIFAVSKILEKHKSTYSYAVLILNMYSQDYPEELLCCHYLYKYVLVFYYIHAKSEN